MCDQTVPYTPGTLVWCKLVDRIWWPGEIVDPSSPPDEFKEFMSRKKVIAVVYFERDNKYEPVINMDTVFLYCCPKKMEFIEKGYTSYKKQKKGGKSGQLNMSYFLEDIINFEKKIDGDENIFDQFEKKELKQLENKKLIKGLFTTNKQTKKNVKNTIESRQSLPALTIPKKSIKSQACFSPKTTKPASAPMPQKGFSCYLQDGCKFTTTRYENLKRHIAEHKNEMVVQSANSTTKSSNTKKSTLNNSSSSNKALFSSSKKRKNLKSKKPVTKKVKLQEELLKDWDLDDAEEDPSENIDNKKNNDDVKNIVDVKPDPQGLNTVEKKNAEVSEVKKSTPGTVFDFIEEDDSTDDDYIPDLRKIKSDDNSSLDEDNNEPLDENCSKPLIDKIIHKPVETEFAVEEHEEDEKNKIDSGVENSALNLDSESNKGHSSSLNESYDVISSSVNKSKTNKSTEDEQSDLKNGVEIESIKLENEAMVKTKSNTSTSEIQLLKDDKNIEDSPHADAGSEQEKFCSNVDSTQIQNVETAMETEDGQYECLLDTVPVPDWAKEELWLEPPHGLLKEVRKYATIDHKSRINCFNIGLLKAQSFDNSFQPTVVHKISEYHQLSNAMNKLSINITPAGKPISMNELLKHPEIQKYRKMIGSGHCGKVTLTFDGDKLVSIDDGTLTAVKL